MQDTSERALVERLRARDEGAVAELAARYGHTIFQLAIRYVRNHEDAEEVVQDVLLKVFRKIDAFRGDAALSSWIFRITFNAAMSRLRRSKIVRSAEVAGVEIGARVNDETQAVIDPPDWTNIADEAMLKAQLRARIATAVSELPPIYREPVILRDLQGLTTEEASTQLRVKNQTLKSRLHRGRLLLRQKLDDFADGLSMRLKVPGSRFPVPLRL